MPQNLRGAKKREGEMRKESRRTEEEKRVEVIACARQEVLWIRVLEQAIAKF